MSMPQIDVRFLRAYSSSGRMQETFTMSTNPKDFQSIWIQNKICNLEEAITAAPRVSCGFGYEKGVATFCTMVFDGVIYSNDRRFCFTGRIEYRSLICAIPYKTREALDKNHLHIYGIHPGSFRYAFLNEVCFLSNLLEGPDSEIVSRAILTEKHYLARTIPSEYNKLEKARISLQEKKANANRLLSMKIYPEIIVSSINLELRNWETEYMDVLSKIRDLRIRTVRIDKISIEDWIQFEQECLASLK